MICKTDYIGEKKNKDSIYRDVKRCTEDITANI